MTLRQAAFRAVVATVVVLAAAVAAVGEAPQTLASTQSHIAVIGDSYTTGSDEGGNGYGQRGSRGSVFGDLTTRPVAQRIAPLIYDQLTIRI
jgi:hypothetical protein